jgi:uncharacterized protein
MLFIAGLFRLIFIGLILYLIFVVVRFVQSIGRAKPPAGTPRGVRGTMVKDEVCNMYLPSEEAVREVVDGREHFFCSDECRRKFLAAANKS